MKACAVVSVADSTYSRRVVRRLCEAGHTPALVLLGSRVEQILFKLNSLRCIRARLGIAETVHRLVRQRHRRPGVHVSEPSVKELAKRFGFRLATYDRINIGTMLVELFRLPHCVTVLAGCGLVDRAFLAVSRGGCVNGHPALLPGLRGFDVVEWALVENIPLGVTAHLVRPTVNAGDILLRREVNPVAQETMADYKTRLMLAQADTLAEAAIQVIQNRASPEPHDLEASRLCFAAPDRVFREAHRAFATKSAPTIDCAR